MSTPENALEFADSVKMAFFNAGKPVLQVLKNGDVWAYDSDGNHRQVDSLRGRIDTSLKGNRLNACLNK